MKIKLPGSVRSPVFFFFFLIEVWQPCVRGQWSTDVYQLWYPPHPLLYPSSTQPPVFSAPDITKNPWMFWPQIRKLLKAIFWWIFWFWRGCLVACRLEECVYWFSTFPQNTLQSAYYAYNGWSIELKVFPLFYQIHFKVHTTHIYNWGIFSTFLSNTL